MQVIIDSKKFSITFAYGSAKQTLKLNGESQDFECTSTTCIIDKCVGSSGIVPENWDNVGKATTICSPFDIFTKAQGRKEALKRALTACEFNRTYRKIMWETYLNRGLSKQIPSFDSKEVVFAYPGNRKRK